MIEIIIRTNGVKILDNLNKKDTNLQEISICLFRLKQIEQKLLDIEFDNDIEYEL